MKSTAPSRDTTRRAILDALAHVVVESKGFGFSVQEVADRAGVTHRTVYNHFPASLESPQPLFYAMSTATAAQASRLS